MESIPGAQSKFLKVRNHLFENLRNGLGLSSDLAYDHRTLHDGNTKFRKLPLIGVPGEATFRFQLEKQRSNSLRQSVENQAEHLTDSIVFFGEFVSNDRQRAATQHIELFEKLHVDRKRTFEISPGSKFRVER